MKKKQNVSSLLKSYSEVIKGSKKVKRHCTLVKLTL